MTVIRYSDWVDMGRTRAQLRQALDSGQLVRLRRGAVAETKGSGPSELHRLKIKAAAPFIGDSTYFGHESAAVLHGLPLLPRRLGEVVAVRAGGGHGAITPTLHARRARLGDADVTTIEGFPVTTLGRTVSDLVRRLPFPEAVMVVDGALRRDVDLAELLARSEGGRGCRMAERALLFGDRRAESAGESLSRVRLHEARLLMPELQHIVLDENGHFVARLDFWWEEQRLAGEFDGLVKYAQLVHPGETTEQVVLAEKRREQDLFDLGIRVIRWTWRDLWTPELTNRIAAALRPGPGSARARLTLESQSRGASPRR